MRLPNPYSLEDTLGKLRHGLTTASNEDALTLLEKAVTKARDDEDYSMQFEETLLRGASIEVRECLSCFGDYFGRSQDAPPYYPYHDAVNSIDCTLYASPPNQKHQHQHHDPDIPISLTRPPHHRWPFAFQGVTPCLPS